MKNLVIFPPQWVPFNPHLAIPTIHSILKNNDYDTTALDLNVEFYNTILTPQFIISSLNYAFANHKANAVNVGKIRAQRQNLNEFPVEFQRKYNRLVEIEKIAKSKEYDPIIQNIKSSVEVIRDKKDFYNLHKLHNAHENIKKACKLLGRIYSPSVINFLEVSAQVYYTVEDLKLNCLDIEGNIYFHFYKNFLPKILETKYDHIGISIGDYTQLVPGLTLAMMLKKNTNAHITIGGNLFGRYTDILIKNPEFFTNFVDSIIYNEGEKPVLELMKYLKGEIKIEEVPNLIYKQGNEIKVTEECKPLNINELYPPEFSDFPLDRYYTPDQILNVQASRNCYWHKCSFCTHHHGSKYAVKTVGNMIKELKTLQEKHNTKYFHFIDEAMSPAYLKNLSNAIIKEGLDVNFYIYGRLEKEFTPELFKLAYKAGLRFVLWGFESANERIYTLMNKGKLTNTRARANIVKSAYEAGIWNHLFIMFGFPSETFDEAKETVHFLKDHINIASFSTGGTFMLLDEAPILKDLDKYSISKVERVRSGFSFSHRFETTEGATQEETSELNRYKSECWGLDKKKYFGSSYREKLFLYVCKYGVKNISKMRDKIWI